MVVSEKERAAILSCRQDGEVILSPREEQMVNLIKAGYGTHKKLARVMFISVGTSKVYMSRIYAKLRARGHEVDSKVDLLTWAWARERGELATYRKITPSMLHPATVINAGEMRAAS